MTVNKSDSIYDARLIREEAEARGYRPVDIASGAGISVETAYGVLRGDNVRVSTLKAVCEMLGLEVRVERRAHAKR